MNEKTELEKAIAFEAIRGRLPDVWILLDIVESTNAPEYQDAYCNLTMPARDGWSVTFFYDVGELDYIDHIITPDNLVISPWDWPYGAPGGNTLRAWGSVGCRARLMDLHRRSPVQVIDCTQMEGELHPGEETCDGILSGRVELIGGWLDYDAGIVRRTPLPTPQVAKAPITEEPSGTFAAFSRAVLEHALRRSTMSYEEVSAEIAKAERQRLLDWWRSYKESRT